MLITWLVLDIEQARRADIVFKYIGASDTDKDGGNLFPKTFLSQHYGNRLSIHLPCRVSLELLNTGQSILSIINRRGSLIHIYFHSHVFGQTTKREHCIDNVKVSNSAWDTNLISASGVSVVLCY